MQKTPKLRTQKAGTTRPTKLRCPHQNYRIIGLRYHAYFALGKKHLGGTCHLCALGHASYMDDISCFTDKYRYYNSSAATDMYTYTCTIHYMGMPTCSMLVAIQPPNLIGHHQKHASFLGPAGCWLRRSLPLQLLGLPGLEGPTAKAGFGSGCSTIPASAAIPCGGAFEAPYLKGSSGGGSANKTAFDFTGLETLTAGAVRALESVKKIMQNTFQTTGCKKVWRQMV